MNGIALQSIIAPAIPRATLRLQLHRHFTFADAAAQIDYFHRLGVSHLYLSPILTARSGSMHGYDVVDHANINPELGGEAGFRRLVAALRRCGMGVIVDIVPNHMAIGGGDNRLWLDVLEWGHKSRYANFFDIDWEVPDPLLRNKILAPFLGQAYGDALNGGEIQLRFDSASGRFFAQYYEHRFPLAPATYAQLLRLGGGALGAFAKRFRDVNNERLKSRGDTFAGICAELAGACAADAALDSALAALLLRFNSAEPGGRQLLHQLLERQHYRLSCWRNAADEINWRRFFDVIQLAGIRIEQPAAFEIVHATIFRLYAEGLIDGLRIDHIDGLADPKLYCRRLRKRLNRLARERPPQAPKGPAYLVVEKILAQEERLPREWQVDGTTGYSFMNEVSALLHDPAGEQPLSALWTELSGRSGDFGDENQRARRRILQELLGAEFNSCALSLHRIARSDPRTRDWSLLAIRRTLQELLVQFPIYRTYADARGRSAADAQIMRGATDAARPFCRAADEPLLDLFDRWLGGEAPLQAPARARRTRLRAIARFQQLSSPLAAKSVEDTAFYRHGKLLSRNEVGSDPAQFANSPDDFHRECARRARYFPHAMLATATHDHKRGEDLRARLAVLSEIPERWARVVHSWIARNAPLKIAAATAPQAWPLPADEYMLYQMLVGSWPLDLEPADNAGLDEFCGRLQQWGLKALREAKQLSSWGEPNTDYEAACANFLRALLDPERSPAFLAELFEFANGIAAAGALNGLSQTLIKLTAPGVPDIYQGCECWDLSLVDPDNRRPVAYPQRARLLRQSRGNRELLQNWRDGGIKQRLIATLLALRREHAELFARGDYLPLQVSGGRAQHVFAFMRRWRERSVVIAALRLPAGLNPGPTPTIDNALWGDTRILLPASETAAGSNSWKNIFSESSGTNVHDRFGCRELFSELPFAVLLKT